MQTGEDMLPRRSASTMNNAADRDARHAGTRPSADRTPQKIDHVKVIE